MQDIKKNELMLKLEHVSKKYRLGVIGAGTLTGDIKSWWARKRGKEDPTLKIGEVRHEKNETFYALTDINFEVKRGEAVGIIGSNGAGKSTTLKLICQVTAPTEGKIYLNGRVTSMLEVGTGFHPELTGRENIYMNGSILGMSKAEIDSKIEQIIDFSEVRQFIDTPVKRYSSGMYVKLAFSVAAHLDSEIVIMDEVLAVGDINFQQKCIAKMKEIAHEEGRTVLYVSHNMATIRQLCDRVIVLNKGTKIFDGGVEEGIQLYSMSKKDDIALSYDLTESNHIYGDCVGNWIPRLLTVNKATDGILCFDLSFDSKKDFKEGFTRMVIHDPLMNPVIATFSEKINDIKKGFNTYRFSFDTSNLCNGIYVCNLMVNTLENDLAVKQFELRRIPTIEITDNNMNTYGTNWGGNWSHVKGKNTTCKKIEIINSLKEHTIFKDE